jgi:hypothetical protein
MKLKIGKPKKLEKHIVSEFVKLFNLDFKIKKYTKHLIRIENAACVWNKRQQEGVVKGAADFLFDYGLSFQYRNLWIEFKRHGNKQTIDQIQFQKDREEAKSKYIVCYSADDAIKEIKNYLGVI